MEQVLDQAVAEKLHPELTLEQAQDLVALHGAPLYVYSQAYLRGRAQEIMALAAPFGLTVRYAMKANPHPGVTKLFADAGLHFDVSSSYEAADLLEQGIAGERISLSSQQPAHNLAELLEAGVGFIATSMHQLDLYAQMAAPGSHLGLRVNAGLGAGHKNRVMTAGPAASFGLWHEYTREALNFARQHQLVIDRLHTHIGSGADPAVWGRAIDTALEVAARMPEVTVLDIGGGYKVSRVTGEAETDMREVLAVFADRLEDFARTTGRRLRLEIEPGGWLVAHAGCLIAEVVDIVDTGADGYRFLRLNTGMNDFLRTTLYGAQHEMRVLSDTTEQADYVVVGHNCETGDVLTTEPGDPETIRPRTLLRARIGDLLVIEDTGAYCASMRAKGYNAFPDAQEILI